MNCQFYGFHGPFSEQGNINIATGTVNNHILSPTQICFHQNHVFCTGIQVKNLRHWQCQQRVNPLVMKKRNNSGSQDVPAKGLCYLKFSTWNCNCPSLHTWFTLVRQIYLLLSFFIPPILSARQDEQNVQPESEYLFQWVYGWIRKNKDARFLFLMHIKKCGEIGDYVIPNPTLKDLSVGVRNTCWYVSMPVRQSDIVTHGSLALRRFFTWQRQAHSFHSGLAHHILVLYGTINCTALGYQMCIVSSL